MYGENCLPMRQRRMPYRNISPCRMLNHLLCIGPAGDTLLKAWYRMLGLQPHSSPSWYRDRYLEELQERREAKTLVDKLCETSDVFFVIIRSRYDGFPVRHQPPFALSHVLIYAYMMAKLTSRWAFYRTAAIICKAARADLVREVVNPRKEYKLDQVATRHRIDPNKFREVCRLLRMVWPLLP